MKKNILLKKLNKKKEKKLPLTAPIHPRLQKYNKENEPISEEHHKDKKKLDWATKIYYFSMFASVLAFGKEVYDVVNEEPYTYTITLTLAIIASIKVLYHLYHFDLIDLSISSIELTMFVTLTVLKIKKHHKNKGENIVVE